MYAEWLLNIPYIFQRLEIVHESTGRLCLNIAGDQKLQCDALWWMVDTAIQALIESISTLMRIL